MQRIFDILFSITALFLLSPLFLPLVLILRLTGEGEIFFLQERIGKHGKPFKLYKFATMLKSSPSIGTGTITVRDDPRILPIGRALRRTKINELPQLLNILFGSMSVVGPRPQAINNFAAFPVAFQHAIQQVRPGLSGIGSIAFRAEENMLDHHYNNIEFYNKIISHYKSQLEFWYVNNASIANYFRVIFVTLWVIFFPNSKIFWFVFRDLPNPPDDLKKYLNYPVG